MPDYAANEPQKKAIVATDDDDDKPAGGADSPSWKSLVDGVHPLRLPGQDLEYELYPPSQEPSGVCMKESNVFSIFFPRAAGPSWT
jgi:hypothetical protein